MIHRNFKTKRVSSRSKKQELGSSQLEQQSTSWEGIAEDYHKIVQDKGHYYHREVILPKLLPLLDLSSQNVLVDIGCGQGILERAIPSKTKYLGLDISPTLISMARRLCKVRSHKFTVQDLTQTITNDEIKGTFSHAVAILSLQNMADPAQAIKNTAQLLQDGGRFFLVLNHPCFRVPRVSSWHYDENKKLMSRKIDRYLSNITIPILAHPGQKQSEVSYSFHFPLSYWVQSLSQHGFLIDKMEEWISPKNSIGKRAKAENICRKEFPLFLLISCIKGVKN